LNIIERADHSYTMHQLELADIVVIFLKSGAEKLETDAA
jgi:hypothetical protein